MDHQDPKGSLHPDTALPSSLETKNSQIEEPLLDKKDERIQDLELRLFAGYQVVGTLADDLGIFNHDSIIKVLDYLAYDGMPDPIPFVSPVAINPSAQDAMGEVIASMMKRDTLKHYRRERDEKVSLDDPASTGHYAGCYVEADEMITRLRTRGYDVMPLARTIQPHQILPTDEAREAALEEAAEAADVVADELDVQALRATTDGDMASFREQEEGAKKVSARIRTLAKSKARGQATVSKQEKVP